MNSVYTFAIHAVFIQYSHLILMKITKVNIPKPFNNNGLEDIKMSRLDKIVLIAGKNGSGKTRLLNKIRQSLEQKPGVSSLNKAREEIAYFEPIIKTYRTKFQNIYHQSDGQLLRKMELEQKSDELVSLSEKYQQSLDWDLIETDVEAENYPYIDFVPKSLQMDGSGVLSKAEIITLATNARGKGFDFLMPGTIASLQRTQVSLF